MVRYCAVPGCSNSDQTVLSHRFPSNSTLFAKWVTCLKVDHIDAINLLNNHTVCCLHFDESAYRNVQSNWLNRTAVPTLSPRNPRMKQLNQTVNLSRHATDEPKSFKYDVVASDCDPTDFIMEDYNELDPALYENNQFDDLSSSNNLQTVEHGEDLGPVDTMNDGNLWADLEHVLIDKSRSNKENANFLKDIIEDCNDSNDGLIEVVVNGDSCDEANDDDVHRVEVSEAATQVNEDDLESIEERDIEYEGVSRKALIAQLRTQQHLIVEQQRKLETFQFAQANLLSSLDAFKSLMGSE